MNKKQRIARFFLSQHWFEHLDLVRHFMAGLVVVKADYCLSRGGIDYTAFGDQFPEVEFGTEAPRWEVVMIREEKDNGSVFTRRLELRPAS